MSLLPIAEFQNLSALSDRALLQLLQQHPDFFRIEPERGLVVDAECCGLDACLRAMAAQERELLREKRRVISERFARSIRHRLDQIVEEALARLGREKSQAGE